MKTLIMYRDYNDNPYTRDFYIFKLDEETLNRTFWVFRTVLGAIANGSKADRPLTKNLWVSIQNAKKEGFKILKEPYLERHIINSFEI